MSRKYYVYLLRLETEQFPFYIGITSEGIDRYQQHIAAARKGKNKAPVYNVIRKAMSQTVSIVYDIVLETSDRTVAEDIEKYLVDFYGRKCKGTGILLNLHPGGGRTFLNGIFTEEQVESARTNRSNGQKKGSVNLKNSKPVMYFDKEGRHVKTFYSAREASRELGISFKLISAVAKGQRSKTSLPSGDMVTFRFLDSNDCILPKVDQGKSQSRGGKREVEKLDVNGILLSRYESISEAVKNNPGTVISSLWCHLNGMTKSYKGFVWKYKS